jgi:hypothetical protein
MQFIRFKESQSGLSARCKLLTKEAPASSNFLSQLALEKREFDASHAIWTGPELSCPLPASVLPESLSREVIPEENATSFPAAGEIVLASLASGSIKGLPPGNFYDIGLFYEQGGRLLMPFGWIKANVCAVVVEKDFSHFQTCMKAIRQAGACSLYIEPAD